MEKNESPATAQIPLLKLPTEKDRPFALIWADEVAFELLRSNNATFSEAVGGLTSPVAGETLETTGGPQNEGGDTTWSG